MSTVGILESLIEDFVTSGQTRLLIDVLMVFASDKPPPAKWASIQWLVYGQLRKFKMGRSRERP